MQSPMLRRITAKRAAHREPSATAILLQLLVIGTAGIGGIIAVFSLICNYQEIWQFLDNLK